MVDILGGKGANIAEMCKLGLPVPPGFTLATSLCSDYLKTKSLSASLKTVSYTHLTLPTILLV